MKKYFLSVGLAALAFGCATDHHHAGNVEKYPLGDVCVVSGHKFESSGPVVFNHEGHEIKLCCDDCKKEFLKSPAKYHAKLHASGK